MIKPGTLLQNRYLVGKPIGAGGMGTVYLGIDHRFENRVAIKETFYQDDFLSEAFQREARLLNNLHHPVLPHVSDYFTENESNFLVMEFIEGADLSEILATGEKLSSADVLRWANQLLDALDYLHSQNPPIIHRDIKPQNLKITTRGDIILLDFGLAKLATNEPQKENSVFGYSRTYSPLEQIENTGTDARSDIFSLGATGYHLLTGRPPISALKRAAAIVAGNPDPLESISDYNPEINESLVHILNTALALDPNERYGSAIAMKTAIEHALNEELAPIPEIVEVSHSNTVSAENLTGESGTWGFPANPEAGTDELSQSASKDSERNWMENRQAESSASFSAHHSESAPPSYRKIAATFVLFALAGFLIIWIFANRFDAADEPPAPAAVQKKLQLNTAEPLPPAEKTTAFMPEKIAAADSKETVSTKLKKNVSEESSSRPVEEKTSVAVPKNKSVDVPAISKKADPAAIKESKTKVSQARPSQGSVQKVAAPKSSPPNLNATTVILVPSSAKSRPRVISDAKKTNGKQSSVSEINRFFTGKISGGRQSKAP